MITLKKGVRKLLERLDCCKTCSRSLSQYNLTMEVLELTKEKPLEEVPCSSDNETNDRVMRSPVVDKSSEEKGNMMDDKITATLWDLCELNMPDDARYYIDMHKDFIELNALNADGYNFLHQAIRMKNKEIFDMLLTLNDSVNINCPDIYQRTPLILATIESDYEMVKDLIKVGALIDKTDEEQNTALHYAIMQQNSPITELIVVNCANVHIKNNKGLSAVELLNQMQPEVINDPSEIFALSEYEEVEINISIPEGVCRPDRPVTLKDFQAVQQIGKGSFGEVFLVKHKLTGEYHAMKVLKKEKIFAHNLQKYVLAERNILSYINHPFIVHLKFAFQDREKVFLILEYCPGGNLSACIRRFGKLDEDVVRIYLCEILMAVSELHRRGIIYRDLKPDNVVLDSNGHALLADFGLSKEGVMDNVSATSFCGSVAYLAPEMIRRQGHGKPVDWYLLGVVMYEMLTGKPPFYNSDKQLLLYNIEHEKLKMPNKISAAAADLIRKLLKRDPQKRIGSVGDAEEIKSHEFFNGVDWNMVMAKELKPPAPPQGSIRTEIVSNYTEKGDEYFEIENRISGWTFVADLEDKEEI